MAKARPLPELLKDIVEWGGRIERHVDRCDFDQFAADEKTQDAVIRCLEVVGEAAGQILKLESDYQTANPGLLLAEAYRARNRTAHGYGSIDLPTVWRSATVSAPELVSQVRKLIL